MQAEHAVHGAQFGGLDELAMGDRHRMQHAFEGALPEFQETLQFREIGTEVIGLCAGGRTLPQRGSNAQ